MKKRLSYRDNSDHMVFLNETCELELSVNYLYLNFFATWILPCLASVATIGRAKCEGSSPSIPTTQTCSPGPPKKPPTLYTMTESAY
ncbi:hypothetical protein LB505_003947 [Fusarium chuoi]|nr:hypothetical protein LB505_003947 [Fusarium chuoi]